MNNKRKPLKNKRTSLEYKNLLQGAPRIPPAPLVTCRSQVCLFRSLLSLCLFYWLFEGLYVLWIGGGCVKRVLGYLVVLRTLWKVEILGNRSLGRCWGGPGARGQGLGARGPGLGARGPRPGPSLFHVCPVCEINFVDGSVSYFGR